MADTPILAVTVLARQRVALGVGSEIGFFTDTHAFVPGSVLRGALAATWIAEHGPPIRGSSDAARFRQLFDGRIRYGPLHAAGAVTVPVSVWLCKYPRDAGCTSQAVDRAFETGRKCPACGGPLEQSKGQTQLPAGTQLDRITRTSIDERTAKAKDGELYAHAALPAGTSLTGFIHGRDPWLELARQLRLGGRRTVGGAVDYHVVPVEPGTLPDPLTADGQLIIRLAGPAIFIDVAGRPRLDPDPVLDLGTAAAITAGPADPADPADPAVAVTDAWPRAMTWSGWHAASRLPKPEEVCAVAGSTYQLDGPPEALRVVAARLRRDGVGLRRTEGFGDIEVVTKPWRPAAPIPESSASSASGASSETATLKWHRIVQELGLDTDQHRWVVHALRDLQLELARGADASSADASSASGDLARDLLARPGAEDFSGRKRQRLGGLFAVTDLPVLRDVTTLLSQDRPDQPDRPATQQGTE